MDAWALCLSIVAVFLGVMNFVEIARNTGLIAGNLKLILMNQRLIQNNTDLISGRKPRHTSFDD